VSGIHASGVLLSVFIGVVFGIQMQMMEDNWLTQPPRTEEVVKKTVIPLHLGENDVSPEQKIENELQKYMSDNFPFSILKADWTQIVEKYDISIREREVTIQVQTKLPQWDADAGYILNAVQGFIKSRLPDSAYDGTYVEVIGEKGDILLEKWIAVW
jgi:hypothetical protein